MSPVIFVVVYWCLASAPLDTFDPHQVDAVARFVSANPATCHASPPVVIVRTDGDMGISLNECRARQIIAYMPTWLQDPTNVGRVYLGAECLERDPSRPEPLNLQALKDRVTP